MLFKKFILSLIFIFIFPVFLFAEKEKVWQEVWGLVESDFYSVCADIKKPDIIFAGTNRSIFKIKDNDKQAQQALSIRGDDRQVNYLVCKNFRGKNTVFAATGQGLFISRNEGRSWNKIFEGKSREERNCLFVDVSLNKIFVATGVGLFYSLDNGRSWSKATGDLGNTQILNIAVDFNNPKNLYVVSSRGIFKSTDQGERWQRIFVSFADDLPSDDAIEDDNASDDPVYESRIKYISQDPNDSNRFFVASDFGIFQTQDSGNSFYKFNDQGLFDKRVKQILVAKDGKIYALSSRSVFEYTDGIWHNIYKGLDAAELRNLAFDKYGNILLAAKTGLFKSIEQHVSHQDTMAHDQEILRRLKNEPSIQEIQKVAIKYAEVSPEKIINWRRQARVKAFIPEFNLSYDKNVYGTSSGVFAVGPMDWGVNFKWNFADFIYSSDQTSIDVRSRLMVQLRDDILNEVTRLYFERKRLQAELAISPPRDSRKMVEKELRLEELTASIDALTGGYLTKTLEKNKDKYSKR